MSIFRKYINYIFFQKYKIINKIGIYINEEYVIDYYYNVIKKLNYNNYELILADKFQKSFYRNFIKKLEFESINYVFLKDVFLIQKYKILITHLYLGGEIVGANNIFIRFKIIIFKLLKKFFFSKINIPKDQYFQKKLGIYNIRFMYGADSGGQKFGEYNKLFNEFFCHGPRDSKIIKKDFSNSILKMGYPRYDNYFLNIKSRKNIQNEYKCNPKKPTILWVCTVSRYFSTIETYEKFMLKLTKNYNVILRPHPLEIDPQYSRFKKTVLKIVNSKNFIINNDPYQDMTELYFIADYVFSDYGGTIFSALYLNKKILLMNHENVHKDEGIFTSTSIEIRNYLPSININDSENIEKFINDQLNTPEYEKKSQAAREIYFGEIKIGSSVNLVVERLKFLMKD